MTCITHHRWTVHGVKIWDGQDRMDRIQRPVERRPANVKTLSIRTHFELPDELLHPAAPKVSLIGAVALVEIHHTEFRICCGDNVRLLGGKNSWSGPLLGSTGLPTSREPIQHSGAAGIRKEGGCGVYQSTAGHRPQRRFARHSSVWLNRSGRR